jgi:hypothetical protein
MKPLVTPSTELATRLRSSPWQARACGSSLDRETLTCPSAIETVIPAGMAFVSSPLGPLTRTLFSSAETSTPLGITTGILPIRDTDALSLPSPDVAEDFAAQA